MSFVHAPRWADSEILCLPRTLPLDFRTQVSDIQVSLSETSPIFLTTPLSATLPHPQSSSAGRKWGKGGHPSEWVSIDAGLVRHLQEREGKKERKKEVKERQRVCVKPRAAKEKKEKSAEKDKDKAGRDGDDA